MKGIDLDLENTTAVFVYDNNGTLLATSVVTADREPDGIAFSSTLPREADGGNEEFSRRLLDHLNDPAAPAIGWLHSTSGRVRAFVVPMYEIAAGHLLRFLDSYERRYFREHPEANRIDFTITRKADE